MKNRVNHKYTLSGRREVSFFFNGWGFLHATQQTTTTTTAATDCYSLIHLPRR